MASAVATAARSATAGRRLKTASVMKKRASAYVNRGSLVVGATSVFRDIGTTDQKDAHVRKILDDVIIEYSSQ